MRTLSADPALSYLEKCSTGIRGLDEITDGGLPRGRPTLVCGGAGCGKTLLAMEFIVRGIRDFNEPGVFMSFEESVDDLCKNVASLGFNLPELIDQGKLAVDFVRIERSEIIETGEYDLEGLFIRLGSMVDQIGARRVALDTLESLFAGLPNEAILRAELRRLFNWLRQRKLTALITAEQGKGTLTRYGLEEYVSDCVIQLDHRVADEVATRRLRIVKYRGSRHGTNEYPTLIDEHGLSIVPISALGLDYAVSREFVSSGIPRLDTMLGSKGYFKGSSVLVSGTAGSGKSSIAVAFANSICSRGERCLYFSFEEAPDQIVRNMASIGFDLAPWVNSGLLLFQAARPTRQGLEAHLASIHKLLEEHDPAALVIDPVSNLVGNFGEIKMMLTRAVDFIKNRGVTALFTNLDEDYRPAEVGISSLMDTWLQLRVIESAGERNRLLYVLKSRGMKHSNQMREFILSDQGIDLRDVYVGPGQVHTGSARLLQEDRDRWDSEAQEHAALRRRAELEQSRLAIEAEIAALQARLVTVKGETEMVTVQDQARRDAEKRSQEKIARARSAD